MFTGQTATIGIFGSGNGNNTPQDFWLICEGPGMFDGGVVTYPGDLSYITYDDFILPIEWEDLGFYNVTTIMYAYFDHSTVHSPYLNGLLIDEIAFHCTGEARLIWFNAADFCIYDTQIIHQIPEPATIILLSIGGLLLRRKRNF